MKGIPQDLFVQLSSSQLYALLQVEASTNQANYRSPDWPKLAKDLGIDVRSPRAPVLTPARAGRGTDLPFRPLRSRSCPTLPDSRGTLRPTSDSTRPSLARHRSRGALALLSPPAVSPN